MDDAKSGIHLAFSWSVTQFFRNFQVTFIVVYGCFKISQAALGIAKIDVGLSFFWSFTQFFRNS